MMATDFESREYAQKRLRDLLPIGSYVGTQTIHVSRSGASSEIQLLINGTDYPYDITSLAARAMGEKLGTHGGIRVGGYGMSRTYAALYGLGRTLWPSGHPCTGVARWHQKDGGPLPCPSNDHANGDSRYQRDHWHVDGGYAYCEGHI